MPLTDDNRSLFKFATSHPPSVVHGREPRKNSTNSDYEIQPETVRLLSQAMLLPPGSSSTLPPMGDMSCLGTSSVAIPLGERVFTTRQY